MKFRHATFIPGTLAAAYSGHVHAIAIAGLATPPDLNGSNITPVYWDQTHDTVPDYAHGGLQLTNVAGQRDIVAYSSWTEAAGVYTFVVDKTLSYSYALGDAAGPLNCSCLRNSLGAHLNSPDAYPALRLADYTDGDINVSGCSAIPGSSNPAWDGSLTPGGLVGLLLYVYWRFYPGTNYSISGKRFTYVSIQHFRDYDFATDMRWKLRLRYGTTLGTNIWEGYSADCQNSFPCGTYIRSAGCAASPSALVVEVAP